MKININNSLLIDIILFNQLIYFTILVFDNINYLWFSLNIIISFCVLLYKPIIQSKFKPLLLCSLLIFLNYFFTNGAKLSSIIFSVSLILCSM